MLGRKYVLLAKVEGTYGSDPTPDTTNDGLYVEDLELSPEIEFLERASLGVALEKLQGLTGKKKYTLSFSTELKGSGTAGVAPKGLSALFKACGNSETIVSSTSVAYKASTNPTQSCTVY